MKNLNKLLLCLCLFFFVSNCSEKEEYLPEAESLDTEILLRSTPETPSPVVPNQYIVVLKENAGPPANVAAELADRFAFSVGHVYEHALRGFSARMPEAALNGLRNVPLIAYIEPDLEMQALAQTTPTGIRRIQTPNIDGTEDAVDVDVAIIDTGLDRDHPDLNVFGGRHFYSIVRGIFVIGSGEDDNYDDDNGHGSHVGGTVGAIDNGDGVVGVAPGARLWGVKVLNANGSGYLSDIIKGIDWVTAHAAEIEVANMSLGGQGYSSAYRTAIQNSVAAGVVYVVAAGNSDANVYGSNNTFGDSDDYIPAAFPEVAAISALADSDGQPGGMGSGASYGPDDSFASFSNYSEQVVSGNPVNSPGKAIDLILPGVSIYSTYKDGGYATASGTSMAAPHAAGLAALYIAQHGRATNATEVYAIRQALIDAGVAQNSPQGLATLNDPDGNEENLGWAGSTGPQNPVANAGPDQTVEDSDDNGSETVTLDGSASYDPDGSISSYEWDTDNDGTTDVTSATATVEVPFSVGTHLVNLTVIDNDGLASNPDQVSITVTEPQPNQPPVANAGADQTVTDSDGNGSETVTLDGSASYDPDGSISSYEWDTDNDGTSDISSATATVAVSFSVGAHLVSLTVIDNEGLASDPDQVSITVNEAPAGLTVTGISPNTVQAGLSVNVTISGTGFVSGASVALENGSGPTPAIANVTVVDSYTITATISTKSGGPPTNRLWDVRVSNPDGGSAVLSDGFIVTP